MSPPFEPLPKQPGDLVRAADWNAAVQEVRRLGAAKLDRDGPVTLPGPVTVAAGMAVAGDLEVSGPVIARGSSLGGGWGARQERRANQVYTAEADGLVTARLRVEAGGSGTLVGETPAGTARLGVALPPLPPTPPPEPPQPEQRQLLTLRDPAGSDQFANAVSVSGDTAVIGCSLRDAQAPDSGAAYVFVRRGGQWVQQDRLVPFDAFASDYFGRAVAVSGDTAVIGAHGRDARGGESGAAYIFVRKGEQWVQQDRLVPDDAASTDYFGNAVSISGDTVVIGAYGKDDPAADAGAAYVFVRRGEQWVQQARLGPNDPEYQAFLGYAVAVAGDTAVIGAHGKDVRGLVDSGAAYVFIRQGERWVQQARLVPYDAAAYDAFGVAVAVSGDTAVIGTNKDARGDDAGAAYVFVRRGEQWVQQARLEPADIVVNDYFGHAVSVAGDTAVIGAYGRDARVADSGMAYVFVRRGEQWSQVARLAPLDLAGGDHFGNAVAVSGATALIGAHLKDVDGRADAGAAYVYHLPHAVVAVPAPRSEGFVLPVRRGDTWVVRLTDTQGRCSAEVTWQPLDPGEEG